MDGAEIHLSRIKRWGQSTLFDRDWVSRVELARICSWLEDQESEQHIIGVEVGQWIWPLVDSCNELYHECTQFSRLRETT